MEQIIEASLALQKRARFVYLSSLDENGGPETRVLFNNKHTRGKGRAKGFECLGEGFSSFVCTNKSSRKVGQIKKKGQACLYYSDNAKFEGLMLSGSLSLVTDKEILRGLWRKEWEMYYKGGLEGGDFAVLLFEPKRGRYYHGLSVKEFDAGKAVASKATSAAKKKAK